MPNAKFTSHRPQVENSLQAAKNRALEICGGTAERYAKENLTKNKSVKTGNLRNSIAHEQRDDSTEAVGSNVEYAPYVELGTSRSKAKPYLRPAVEDNRDEYEKIIRSELSGI